MKPKESCNVSSHWRARESYQERDLDQARTSRDTAAADYSASVEQVHMKAEAIAMAEAELHMAEASLRNAEAVVEQRQATLDQS